MAVTTEFHTIANKVIRILARSVLSHWMSDKLFIRLRYWGVFGYWMDFKNPKTFNEKLNWLKMNQRNPILSTMVDKYEAKNLVAEMIGPEYVVKTIRVYNNVDEINLDELPTSFVLKCTHDSGSVVVCKDKYGLDINHIRNRLRKRLKRNLFWWGREWPYKDVKPRIIVEEYLHDDAFDTLPAYKFFCFNGTPAIIQTVQNDKSKDEYVDYFTIGWTRLCLQQKFPNSPSPLSRPENLQEMLDVAGKLSAGFPFIRIDLYKVNTSVKFSEFTFYSDCGFVPFIPEIWDYKLGNLINIG